MLSLRNILLLVTALVLAGGTAFYVNTWLAAERAQLASRTAEVKVVEAETAEVLVARHDLPAGAFLKPENLTWQAWPEDGVHENHILKQPSMEDDGKGPLAALDGAVIRTGLRAGEPVSRARVVHPGERGFLAAVLEPGFRAVSVPVDATSGIAGFVFPGDWVDVLMTMKLRDEGESKRQRFFSQTVLERVRVLAVDQDVENPENAAAVAKTATIEVTPKEAERIAIALEMGRLAMSLNSLSSAEVERAHQERLIGGGNFDPNMVRNETKSYTLDTDVYHMWGDPRLFNRGGAARTVNVVRGSDAEVQSF